MTSAAVVLPHPNSPGAPGTSPVKIDTPSVRPPSPSAPPAMFGSAAPMYDRRDSGESEKDEHGRSRSTPMNRPISPAPKRTYSTGNLPAFTPSAILSPPSFHATNHRNSSPESRRTRSSENIPQNYSSPESSPQQHMVGLGGSHYQNGGLGLMSMRPSEHHNYANQDYDVMMRPKKRHKTSRACDECRRKKVIFSVSSTYKDSL
jgi:hypothetical protein